MLNKRGYLFAIALILIISSFLIFGCGKQGIRFTNQVPSIEITSYEGYDPANPYTDSTRVTLFQQKIYWHASDPDGIIAGFAYRILDKNNQPLSTPGNRFIDADGLHSPQNVLDRFGRGWVLHYQPGADQSIPLDNDSARKTIWSSQKYAVINFPAADQFGNPDTTICKFEVICVDNRGEICNISAFRTFRSYSTRPVCFATTTKGRPNGGQVGTGIRMSFSLTDFDPYIQPTAYYYELKIEKRATVTNALISTQPSDGSWVNTLEDDDPHINQYLLTKNTSPLSLSSDYNGDTQVSYTKVICRVIDLAGIVSDTTSVRFAVKEGFHPQTLIYGRRIYGLGANHYITYNDESTQDVLPYTVVGGQIRFGTPLFKDTLGVYTAVHSQNLKIWVRWGFHGEYGIPLPSGTTLVTNNPFDKKVDLVLDASTSKNYFSEIVAFDVSVNGEPYNYPPLLSNPNNIKTDSTWVNGQLVLKRWLRVPINSNMGQTGVLTNMLAQTQRLEVRAVDLQGVVDPTPELFAVNLIPPVSQANRSGILVIDDEPHNAFSPADSVDARYSNMLSGYSGPVKWLKRENMAAAADTVGRRIAFSTIQNYKLIIYHSDNPTGFSNLLLEHDAFALYLYSGGNMVISGGANISGVAQSYAIAKLRTLSQYFGITYSTTSTGIISNSLIVNPFMVKANLPQVNAIPGYNELNIALDLNPANPNPDPYITPDFTFFDPNELNMVSTVNSRKGLGPVSYFIFIEPGTDVLYKYGCKPTSEAVTPGTSPYFFPTVTFHSQNNNNRNIALRKISQTQNVITNKCYIFGFPLSYIKKNEAKGLMTKILSELNLASI